MLIVAGYLVFHWTGFLMQADVVPNYETPTYVGSTFYNFYIKDGYLFSHPGFITYRYNLATKQSESGGSYLLGYEDGKSLTQYTRNDDIMIYDWNAKSLSDFLPKATMIEKINSLPLDQFDQSSKDLINSEAEADKINTDTKFNSGIINIRVALFDNQGAVFHLFFGANSYGFASRSLLLHYNPTNQELSLIKYYNGYDSMGNYHAGDTLVRYGNNVVYESGNRIWQYDVQTKLTTVISPTYSNVACVGHAPVPEKVSYGPVVYKDKLYYVDVPGCSATGIPNDPINIPN